MGNQRVKDLGGEPASLAHAGEALWPVKLDNAVFRFEPVVGGDGDVLSHGVDISPNRHKPNRSF